MSETELVKACLDYLTSQRVFHHRNNTGALRTQGGGFVRFGALGSPDIIAVVKGRYVGIECKVGRNRQSEPQKTFEARLRQAGGEYWLIRSIDELILKFC